MQTFLTTVGVVVIINMLSRALALVTGSFVTGFFGVSVQTSAYSFALMLNGAVTTAIGTTLTTAVIPIYTRLREIENKRAEAFINNTISLTVIAGTSLALLGILTSPLTATLAKGGDYHFTIYAICTMMPAIVFMSIYFVFSGVLQANNKFYIPAMVSIPSSIINMAYILLLSKHFGVAGLVVATMIGFFTQSAMLYLSLKKTGFPFRASFDYKNPDIAQVFKVVGPVIIGVCAYQVNLLTNGSLAFSHDPHRYIVLNNVQNLGIQIVMTLILAVAAVIYPKFSALAAKNDLEGLARQYISTINAMVLLLVPISVLFVALSTNIVDIVYGYGKFTPDNVKLGGQIFACYSLGIVGLGFKEITDRAFYSVNNTKISALNGVVIMVVNIVASLILVRFYGLYGIAIAYSIAAIVGGVNIIFQYKRHHKQTACRPILTTTIKAGLSAVLMIIVIYFANRFITIGVGGKLGLLVNMAVKSVIGLIVYALSLVVFRTKEAMGLLKRD